MAPLPPGPTEFTARLAPVPGSVGDARRLIRSAMRSWGQIDVADDAVLIASELVTNAVTHAQTDSEITVRLLSPDGQVRIEVADGCEQAPAATEPDPDGASGRGMAMVASLSAAWGVELRAGSKTVWADVLRMTHPRDDPDPA